MKWVTLGFIFDSSMDNVLMLCKFRTPHPFRLYGIMAEVIPGENPLESMIREMTEITGYLEVDTREIKRLVTLSDLPGLDADDRLLVYGIVLEEGLESKVNSGTSTAKWNLFWQHVYRDKLLDPDNGHLAGDGVIAFGVKLARTMMAAKTRSEQV